MNFVKFSMHRGDGEEGKGGRREEERRKKKGGGGKGARRPVGGETGQNVKEEEVRKKSLTLSF